MYDAQAFIRALHETSLTEPDKPHAFPDSYFRHSDATGCARALYYKHTNAPATKPNAASVWVMRLGTLVHDTWQAWLGDTNPAIDTETKVSIRRARSSGHADAHEPDTNRVYELKTTNGTAFRQIAKNPKPKAGAVAQGALNGYALNADELVVTYISMEGMSDAVAASHNIHDAADRVSRTFVYTADEFMPIAEAEVQRWEALAEQFDAGEMPARIMADDDYKTIEVADPLTGKLFGPGRTWRCGYCKFQMTCASDAAFGK